jgi:hypothetical protein
MHVNLLGVLPEKQLCFGLGSALVRARSTAFFRSVGIVMVRPLSIVLGVLLLATILLATIASAHDQPESWTDDEVVALTPGI